MVQDMQIAPRVHRFIASQSTNPLIAVYSSCWNTGLIVPGMPLQEVQIATPGQSHPGHYPSAGTCFGSVLHQTAALAGSWPAEPAEVLHPPTIQVQAEKSHCELHPFSLELKANAVCC